MFRELGERLHSYRVDAGIEIKDLAARTRIASSSIEALEQGRMDLLPGQAFVKGFVRAICAELGRDPIPLLEIYDSKMEELSAEEENSTPENRKAFPVFLVFAILFVLIVGGILLYGGKGEEPEMVVEDEPPVSDLNVVPSPETASIPSTTSRVEVAPRELDLVIRAVEKTWLRIQADSSQPWETTLKTGDEIRLKAMNRIRLFIGNAGGIIFELNGRRFGPPGSQGQVISDYVITRDNL